ncbi:MAG TPA: hypothetical protein VNX29_10195 [Kaistia sp.]|nr:hypothetical protein [Kaistia sp.]
MAGAVQDADGETSYEVREVVAVFDNEKALQAAVDALISAGLDPEDMSVLADPGKLAGLGVPVSGLEDDAKVGRASYVPAESRVEASTALAGGPALIVGLGAALAAGTAGLALIPTLALTIGGTLASGGAGMLLARFFGHRHADFIRRQIEAGGLVLWVHSTDSDMDRKIVNALAKSGARDIHQHVIKRSWGVDDVPLHDFNPDPLVRE